MASNGLTRISIENRIVEQAAAVQVSHRNLDWLSNGAWQAYLAAWQDLIAYHQTHLEPVVGMEVLRDYHEFMRALWNLHNRWAWKVGERQVIADHIATLEYLFDAVITHSVSSLFDTPWTETPLDFWAYLREDHWSFIEKKHPALAGKIDMVRGTLAEPDEIRQDTRDPALYYFYRRVDDGFRCCAVVRHLMAYGLLANAYLTDNARLGEQLWSK